MASSSSFSISEAVGYGWKQVTSNLKFFIPLALVVMAVSFAFQMLMGAFQESDASLLIFLFVLIYIFVQLVLSLGIVKVAIDFVKKRDPKISDLFTQYPLVLRYLGATLVMVLPLWIVIAAAGGLAVLFFTGVFENVPLVVPLLLVIAIVCFAVWWQTRLQFYSYFIVDKNLGAIESLKRSFQVTKGLFWKLFFFGLLLSLINLLGVLALVIGLFVTIPLDWVARAYVYNKIS